MNEPIHNITDQIAAPLQQTILIVSNDINIRHWLKDNFGDYRIAVCTSFLDFTAELKWEDSVKLVLIDYLDELIDIWEIVEILDTTHPSLPAALLAQTKDATDDILQRAPHKKIITLYNSLEMTRARIREMLSKSEAGENTEQSNLTDEIDRLAENVETLTGLSKRAENVFRQNGFDGIIDLRRLNLHLENLIGEWNHLS